MQTPEPAAARCPECGLRRGKHHSGCSHAAARSLDRECPTCGAAPGERCKDTAFEGTTHFERLGASIVDAHAHDLRKLADSDAAWSDVLDEQDIEIMALDHDAARDHEAVEDAKLIGHYQDAVDAALAVPGPDPGSFGGHSA